MDCLSPIKIYNPRKFVSLDYDDLYVLYARCGKCINCQSELQKQWYFRAYYEYLDCIRKGGYMLMDCLSYSEKYCPRVSRFISDLPAKFNFRCFDYMDVRLFLVRLRTYLTRKGFDVKNKLRYFFSSEYGTSENYVDSRGRVRKGTHRPHYHILFYVTDPNLDNVTLSRAISYCWEYGRTDGIKYRGRVYLDNMTIRGGVASAVRSCKYVSKYVLKDSEFQNKAEKRLNAILFYIYKNRFSYFSAKTFRFSLDYDSKLVETADCVIDWDSFFEFQQSETAKKIRRDYWRALGQFHKQSLGFGASFLEYANIEEIIDSNIITIPDGKKVVNRIGLPTYYKRKLFYELVEPIENYKCWQLNDLGLRYVEKRKLDRKNMLLAEYRLAFLNYGLKLDNIESLVEYVVNSRGRIRACNSTSKIDDILRSNTILYNYVTSSDKKEFHIKFLSDRYFGNSKHYTEKLPSRKINPLAFELENVNCFSDFEDSLTRLSIAKRKRLESESKLLINKQRLNRLYKTIFQ